jgi:hypothetical protein
LKRKLKIFSLLLIWVCLTITPLFSQPDSTGLWTNEAWRESKDGIAYSKIETKEVDNVDLDIDEGWFDLDWNFSWLKSPYTKFIVIAIVIILLSAALVYFLSGNIKGDKTVKTDLEFDLLQMEEAVLESDFDRFLRLALESNDYRIAVRILFLRLLQRLHEAEWIVWKKNKTNQDFLNEVRGRENYVQFRDLTLAFEIVWYGDQKITKQQFDQLQNLFDSFQNNIK